MSADIATKLNADGAAASAPLFVINLCASTSPMALTHPNTPELKRYTFFVSRQREDGRERFRLHMGYFSSQEEAESLLAAVRDVYPAAWAGPAPTSGVPRRARVTAVPPIAAPTPAPPVQAPQRTAAEIASAAPVRLPPVQAPPVLETMSNVRNVLAQLDEQVRPAPPVTAAPAAAVKSAAPSLKPDVSMPAAAVAAPPKAAAAPPKAAAAPPVFPARSATPVLNASQTLQVLEADAPSPPIVSLPVDEDIPAGPAVRIVTPEDTQTLRDIRLDAQNNAPPCFAVQLIWAVSPIDVGSLPHLAIFDAYTLYNVEGSRQGRKWYGLRLGFFSDPHSATQVAHYVRADYQAVAVVPVALRERDNAKGGSAEVAVAPRLGDTGAPQKPQAELNLQAQGLDGFELLKDDRPPPDKRDLDDLGAGPAAPKLARDRIAAAAAGAAAAAAAAKPASARPAVANGKVPVLAPAATPGKATGKPSGKRVVVRKRPDAALRTAPGAPQPLESTLEILGASTLTLDEGREIVNDSAVRKPIEKKSGSRFSKLLTRLSGG